MIPRWVFLIAALTAATTCAAVDINRATQAELESVKGIGPELSTHILAERAKSPFKDWNDLIRRVKGVGPGSAARHSAEGLSIDGMPYRRATAASVPRPSNP